MSANTEIRSIIPTQSEPRKRLSIGLMALAVVSSIIASTCCVVPLLLVLVGITGAWMVNLTALQPFSLAFSVVAVAALAWAGYLVYRPMSACSPGGADCDVSCRTTRRVFIGCAVFIVALLLFPFAAPLFY